MEKLTRFEEGKEYIFTKEAFYGNPAAVNSEYWVELCHGKKVTVTGATDGYIDVYCVCPDWCEEVTAPAEEIAPEFGNSMDTAVIMEELLSVFMKSEELSDIQRVFAMVEYVQGKQQAVANTMETVIDAYRKRNRKLVKKIQMMKAYKGV